MARKEFLNEGRCTAIDGWLIVGWILLGVVLLLLTILWLPLRVSVTYNGEGGLSLVFKALWVPVYKLRVGERKKKEKPKEKPTEKPPKTEKKEPIEETVSRLIALIKSVLAAAKTLLSHCRVKRLGITAVCAGEDAADVAMTYGTVCSTLYPFVGYLQTLVKVDARGLDVRVGCDFEAEKPTVSLNATVSVCVWWILWSGRWLVRTLNEES